MSIFIERVFLDINSNEVILKIFTPVKEGEWWNCHYTILDKSNKIESSAGGCDSMDALLSALAKSNIYLTNSKRFLGRNLYWIDEGDLGIWIQYY